MRTILNSLLNDAKSLLKFWNQFWFAPVDLSVVSLFRMCVCTVLFFCYIERQWNIETYYFDSGYLPVSEIEVSVDKTYNPGFQPYLSSDTANFYAHLLFLGLLLAMAAGFGGRKTAWLLFILHMLFVNRNRMVNYGVDIYATFWFLYLCLIDSTKYFRLDSWWKKTKPVKPFPVLESDWVSTVGFRLIQIQLLVAYAYTGMEKLKGQTWWNGTAVWTTLMNPQITPWDFSWMKDFPLVIATLTYVTLIYEVYAPVGFVWPKTRKYFVMYGMMFHFMIGAMMSLIFFAFLMMAGLTVFIDPVVVRSWLAKFQRAS